MFGVGLTLAALMPNYWLFGLALIIVGIAALTLTSSSNSLMQLTTDPIMRGRVMAIRIAIILGGTPLGAPVVGWIADRFGPRWALAVGAASGFAAAIVAILNFVKHRHLRLHIEAGRLRLSIDDAPRDKTGRQADVSYSNR